MDETEKDVPANPGPLMYRDEDERHLSYFSALGRFVVHWAELEHHFDLNMMKLYLTFGGNEKKSKPPSMLQQKIVVWRNAFNSKEEFSPFRTEALKFADDFEEMREDRNVLLHFNWATLISDPNALGIDGTSLKPVPGGYHRMGANLTLASVRSLTARVVRMNAKLLFFTMNLNKVAQSRER